MAERVQAGGKRRGLLRSFCNRHFLLLAGNVPTCLSDLVRLRVHPVL